VRGTTGAEGDQVDAFVNTRKGAPSDTVFVIDQMNQEGGFDEHKVMVGFRNEEEAVRAYKAQYEEGWKVGPVTQMTGEQFKRWVKEGKKDQPVSTTLPREAAQASKPTVTQEGDQFVVRHKGEVKFKNRSKKAAEAFARGVGRQVKLALPSGMKIEVEEETFDPNVFPEGGGEITLEVLDNEEVVGGVTADVYPKRKTIRIAVSKLDEKYQGRKIGLEMYNTLIEEARSRGFVLESDTGVSQDAQRIYEALERRGVKVWRNPQATFNERGTLLSHEIRTPVYRIDLSGVTEPIKLSLGEVMAEEDADYMAAMDELPVVHEEVADYIEKIAATFPQVGNVEVYPSVEYAPHADAILAHSTDAWSAKGAYVAEEDVLYIFTGNLESFEDGMRVFLHEAVAHRGLDVLLGTERKHALMDDIWAGMSEGQQREVERIAKAYERDVEDLADRREAVEEYVAHLAERNPQASILQRVVDAVRQFLREIGLLGQWTDNDIHALLRDTRRALRGKPLSKVRLETEVEIEETGEVVVLEERADRALSKLDKRRSMVQRLVECVG